MEEIKPSGWITTKKPIKYLNKRNKETNCKYEFKTGCKNIIPIKDCEELVAIKSM